VVFEVHVKFNEIGLQKEILSAVDEAGFTDCTAVQEAVAAPVLEGKDVSGLAQTGTGKTAAFVIPLLDRVLRSKKSLNVDGEEDSSKVPFSNWQSGDIVLILVPTRELAEQVYTEVKRFAKHTDIKGVAIYGGTTYEQQKRALEENVEFVIGTPGRLIDLYKQHLLNLKQVRAFVFDEADRMFDMGFKDDMKYLLRRVPKDRQFLVFGATLNFEILHTAYYFGADPIEFDLSRDEIRAENVDDEVIHIGQDTKPAFLLSVLKKENPVQTMIFSNLRFNVQKITDFLIKNGYPAVGISSLLSQAQRNRVLAQFKGKNDRNILVATDLAARGLDIKGVDLVINFDLPDDPENYVHRIGRTGRAGEEGRAYSLVSDRDVEALTRIENYLKEKVKVGWFEDDDVIQEFEAFPEDDRFKRKRRPQERGPRSDRGGRSDRGARGGPSDRGERGGPSDRGARGGPSDRGERGDRPRKKTQRKSTKPRQSPAKRTETKESEVAEKVSRPAGTHRDRLSGRHGSKVKPAATRKKKVQKRRSSKQHRSGKRTNQSVASPPKSEGKLKSFIKKLFS
jgi:ATP-dependent RNA helicase RhlB